MENFKQRWYDQDQTMAKSIELMETFPEEIQTIIAEGIIRLAERQCQADELMNNIRSLGAEKVLGIYKSKNKRREYDQNQLIHQALNYLFILTDEYRLMIARQVIEIVNYIYAYLKTCQTVNVGAQMDDVSSLVRTYIEVGPNETQELLIAIQTRFNQGIAKAEATVQEGLTETRQGMKVAEGKKAKKGTPPKS